MDYTGFLQYIIIMKRLFIWIGRLFGREPRPEFRDSEYYTEIGNNIRATLKENLRLNKEDYSKDSFSTHYLLSERPHIDIDHTSESSTLIDFETSIRGVYDDTSNNNQSGFSDGFGGGDYSGGGAGGDWSDNSNTDTNGCN